MFKKKKPQMPTTTNAYTFTHSEIDLLSECIDRTKNLYKGMLLLKEDWNAERNEQSIAFIKTKLRMLDELQDKTSYIGQHEIYR